MFLPEPSYSGGEGTKAIETLNNFEAHHRHAAMASRRIVHRFTVHLKFNFIHSTRSGSSIGSIGGRTNSMPSIPIKLPKCQRFGKLMSSRRRKYFIYLPPVSEDQPKWLLVFRLKRHHSASRKLTRQLAAFRFCASTHYFSLVAGFSFQRLAEVSARTRGTYYSPVCNISYRWRMTIMSDKYLPLNRPRTSNQKEKYHALLRRAPQKQMVYY